MSGWSDTTGCPRCGNEECSISGETRPFDQLYMQCYNCGLVISPRVELADAKTLKLMREDYKETNEKEFVPTPMENKEWQKEFDRMFKQKKR